MNVRGGRERKWREERQGAMCGGGKKRVSEGREGGEKERREEDAGEDEK